MGGTDSAMNCSGANEVGCGKAIAQGAAIGGIAGAASGAAGAAASGISATVIGEVGLATNSGLLAASAGAAVEGAFAGAALGAVSYTAMAALGNTDGWNWGDFFAATFGGLASGAFMGGLSGAFNYGLSNSFQQQTYQTVEDYAYENGRHIDAMTFDNAMGLRQRAIDYYAYRVRGYTSLQFEYSDVNAGIRGFAGFIGEEGLVENPFDPITIYSDAFKVPNDGGWNFDDITGMMQTVDHEARHRFMNGSYFQAMKYDPVFSNYPMTASNIQGYVEMRVYSYNASVAKEYGYSPLVKKYVNDMAGQLGRTYNLHYRYAF